MQFDTEAGFQSLDLNSSNAGTRAQVSLSYLRSYRGMGLAEVACVSGCACKPQALDGTWDKQVSLQQVAQLWVSPRVGWGQGSRRLPAARGVGG